MIVTPVPAILVANWSCVGALLRQYWIGDIKRMLGWLDWIFGEKAEARQLNRDARAIVNAARAGYRPETQREMSVLTGTTLATAHERGGDDPAKYQPLINHFKMMHRDAKHARNQTQLTAYTLIIIYLRSEQMGDLAADARREVDEFIAAWAHTSTEESVLNA